jgi:hypothetical protein
MEHMKIIYFTLAGLVCLSSAAFSEDLQILTGEQSAEIVRELIVRSKSISILPGKFDSEEDKAEVLSKDFDLTRYLLERLVLSNVLAPVGKQVFVPGVETVCSGKPLTCTLKIFNTMLTKQSDGFNESMGSLVVSIEVNVVKKGEAFEVVGDAITLGTEILSQ